MDLNELFGEGTLKTLAIAAGEDARAHLAAGHPLRAAFSAAHCAQLTPQRPWDDSDQTRMVEALSEEVQARLRSADDTAAAWRAGYLRLLGGEPAWTEADLDRMVRAVSPRKGLRPWRRVWFAGQAADYHLLTGSVFWTEEELATMLETVRDDFVLRLRNADRLMAADRVVLYKVLASTSRKEAS